MARSEAPPDEHLVDLLSSVGTVALWRIVDGGVVCLKADEVSQRGCLGMAKFQPFVNQPATMPYHEVLADLRDNRAGPGQGGCARRPAGGRVRSA